MKPVVYLATDHAGFALKNILATYLRDTLHCDVVDCGAHSLDDADDYPDTIAIAARKISENPTAKAIILGGSGQGEAMVANRFPNVRATVYYGGDDEILALSREHNDANVLSLGARFLDDDAAKKAVSKWLSGEFTNEPRHQRRIKKIEHATRT